MQVPVQSVVRKKTFRYLYDVGDSWDHRIRVKKLLPSITCAQVPYCVDGANACPPEDVAVGRYADFLEAMADRSHPASRYAGVTWQYLLFNGF
ncbi:plasmid pRiA4b ORF-3 family protein [Pseudomonas sp. RT6P73]